MIRLSPRLQLLLDSTLPGEPLWDLCCDHGLLGLRALEMGSFPEVHFVDQVPHIMGLLKARLDEHGDGLVPALLHVSPAEVLDEVLTGSVVIAGVGGEKIIAILSSLKDRGLIAAKRLVLSPHKDEGQFEKDFARLFPPAQWGLVALRDVQEGPRVRKVWIFDRLLP